MIEVIQDNEGRVIAYATIFHLNKFLQYDPTFTEDELDVAFIDRFWKHGTCELSVKDCIKIMVSNHLNKYPKLYRAHFNHHHDGRRSSKFHWFTKEQMMKMSGKHG